MVKINIIRKVYLGASIIKVCYTALLLVMVFSVLSIFSPYQGGTSQRYYVEVANLDEFVLKLKEVCSKEASYGNIDSAIVLDGYVNYSTTYGGWMKSVRVPYSQKDSLNSVKGWFECKNLFVHLYLKDEHEWIMLTVPIPYYDDWETHGRKVIFLDYWKRKDIFSYGISLREIKKDINICRTFEKNILSKMCKYRKDYIAVPIIWLGTWFEHHFKLVFLLFFCVIAISAITKRLYYNSTYPNV